MIKKELIKSEAIEDGAITSDKIGVAAITVEKLHPSAASGVLNNSIDTVHLIDLCVVNNKIAFNAVTNDRILNNTISNEKLLDNTIDNNKMKDSAIVENKIANNSISTDKLKLGSITVEKLNQDVITHISNIKKEFFDELYPIGRGKYIQFPDALGNFETLEDPNFKFPNTVWEKMFSTEGVFFRTEGGLSSESRATNKIQPHAFQAHEHRWYFDHDNRGTGGSARFIRQVLGYSTFRDTEVIRSKDGYGTVSISAETRPQNRLMIIWLRTG